MNTTKHSLTASALQPENDFSYPEKDLSANFDRECQKVERVFISASKMKSLWRQRLFLDMAAIGLGVAPRGEFRKLYQIWLSEQGGQNNAE